MLARIRLNKGKIYTRYRAALDFLACRCGFSGIDERQQRRSEHPGDPSRRELRRRHRHRDAADLPTSTFAHGNPSGFDYTRSGNPNFRILDAVLASVEGCNHATVFASGVSAITAVVSQLQQGDLVLCEENLYGCTVRLFEQVFAKFGLRTAWVDFTSPEALETIRSHKPAMVWLESPTNPLLKVIDLQAVCAVTQPLGIPVLVDNTFATALVQQPLELEPPVTHQHHQVHQRPLRRSGGSRLYQRPGMAPEDGVLPEGARPAAIAVRLLADHPRHQDPAAALAAADGQRRRSCRPAGRTTPG